MINIYLYWQFRIALYEEVLRLNYPAAHAIALVLLLISLLMLGLIALLQRKNQAPSLRLPL
ncbi:hypothetical protein PO883_22860 [Massilia sp. DJPM01]|uniref:hypothetical protein n=1 Tax=Massilia sp. DJPM01 TaxID=3024404 RepID=UPI00259E05B2|nr:hypothetical protein [Massilia sp. DJPM01]MDM5180033.1 hypothetical protein [Massilia sp. DJPM01]